MLVTPELSQEIERMLPKSQEDLARLAKSLDEHMTTIPKGTEFSEIMLSVGDIDLLVRRFVNTKR